MGKYHSLGVCVVGVESRKEFLFQPQLNAVLKSSGTPWGKPARLGTRPSGMLPTYHGLLAPAGCSRYSALDAFQAQPFQASFRSWKPLHPSLTWSISIPDPPLSQDISQPPISICRCSTLSLLCPHETCLLAPNLHVLVN